MVSSFEHWWVDISSRGTATNSKEWIGYPTQKPEALLERIIKASSNEGDMVLDPMCGCGTAIAVAEKLKRRWIGIDVSPTACRIMVSQRMNRVMNPEIYEFDSSDESNNVEIKAIDLYGYPIIIDQLKKLPVFEFENIVCEAINARRTKKTGDMGVDAFTEDEVPVQIKRQSRIGRNVIDNFKSAIQRVDKTEGIIVGFSFTKGAHEEVARLKLKESIDIKLSTIHVNNHGKIVVDMN